MHRPHRMARKGVEPMKTFVARFALVLVVLAVLFGSALRIVRSSQADQGGREDEIQDLVQFLRSI